MGAAIVSHVFKIDRNDIEEALIVSGDEDKMVVELLFS